MNQHVLIIDDEERLRTLLSKIISLEGFEVTQAGDCKTGLNKLDLLNIDVIICDVKLPDGNGVDFIKTIKARYSYIEVILLTAFGNISDGVEAIKNGAFDYIIKGDDNNKIIPLLYKALEKVSLTKRVLQLEKQLGNKYSFEGIIGQSKSIKKSIETAQKVAITDASVLLTGETGTGKEIFAQAIHTASYRARHNFIAINCSAFSKDLLENELFGHKAGAFTGAIKETKGIFEEANGGSVFLDEIGEMPLDLQAKLLRVLETGEFFKVGDSKLTKVNVRIIAATNRDLKNEIIQNRFREDLYYRISVFQIELAPLRQRTEDIEALAYYFMKYFALKMKKSILSISSEYLNSLKKHTWKGNIRELKNILERSVILTNSGILELETLPDDFEQNQTINSEGKSLSAFDLSSAEKIHIQKVLNYTKGNKTETAKLLNIALTTLYRKLEEYKIS
ncbi:sigma-54-dependent Fis family transcriptional regulator [Cytophagaceae bacterium 50C-KIRBA]|uniref:Sigma-54-dependent Fis family transcriptional regulator n=1 Tax=Aquirufa beregesia TaxID=2516556 RepID=A0ABX0F1D1_9BACT|nr:sigma-54 dependent transcriptional regulator [Aquirufa beregesia]NGZ43650.1 sigma-54-dependent Fis family transcriptional regulator [Aquirufa beregesia]